MVIRTTIRRTDVQKYLQYSSQIKSLRVHNPLIRSIQQKEPKMGIATTLIRFFISQIILQAFDNTNQATLRTERNTVVSLKCHTLFVERKCDYPGSGRISERIALLILNIVSLHNKSNTESIRDRFVIRIFTQKVTITLKVTLTKIVTPFFLASRKCDYYDS